MCSPCFLVESVMSFLMIGSVRVWSREELELCIKVEMRAGRAFHECGDAPQATREHYDRASALWDVACKRFADFSRQNADGKTPIL